MSEYSLPINTELYKYIQPMYVTEPTGERQTFIPLRLNLNNSNFNFDLARSDGLDFHLAESSNGSGVLQMWIAYWNVTAGKATVWFKLPKLEASETRIFFAIWGYEYDTGISNLEDLVSGYTNIYSDNLCIGGTVTGEGTSGVPHAGNNPDLAFDRDLNTNWRASPVPFPGTGTWIQYDFGVGNEKRIQLIKMYQYDGKDFVFQGSKDGIIFTDLFSVQLDDTPGGTYPLVWSTTAFDNDTPYRYIRVRVLSAWSNLWLAGEIEMMEVASRTVGAGGVFYFGDDFDGSSLDVSKWPTTNGSWTMGNSSISLGTDAWINSGDVLGDASTFYVGSASRVTIADGLWGNRQAAGTCYLSYNGYLAYHQDELIDGDFTSYNEYSYIASPNTGAHGCGIGVDLGVITDKISKIRAYIYDITEANLSDLEWPSTAYIALYKSNTNAAGDQRHVYTYTPTEIHLVKFANNVWYFDLNFIPPGETTRYFHILGNNSLSAVVYKYSEVEVYTRNTESNFLASNFIVEEGVIGIGNPSATNVAAHRYRFYGGENYLGIDYFWEGSTDRKLDVITANSYVAYPGTNKGLIIGEYNQSYLGYYEATDRVYQGMSNRGGDSIPVYSDDLCTAGDVYAAASKDYGHPYGPEAAFDDNQNTYWAGLDGPAGTINWIGYEFVSPQKITRVLILWGNAYSYNIEGSNGSEPSWGNKSWTILSAGTGDLLGTWTEDIFDNPIQYRYVRVNITAFSGNAPFIYEIKMFRADSFSSAFDYDDSWERGVHRNTQLANFRIYGEDLGSANGVAIDWVIARPFVPDSDPIVDASTLWVDYEYVRHQQLDYSGYAGDVTSVSFYHSSDMGGDPYKMSDNITNNPAKIFVSAAEITEGNIIIDFGRYKDSVTSVNYIHFNSDSVYFYNASKLSDLDTDVHGRDYWQSTTTPGWAAIQFPDTKDITCLYLRAVPGNAGKMVKDFKFYGSQSDPRFSGWDDKVLIYEGSAREIEGEQTFYFSTGLTFYKYYILEAIVSFDDYETEKINTPSMTHDSSYAGDFNPPSNTPENVSDGSGNSNSYMQIGPTTNQWVSIDLGSSESMYKVLIEGRPSASDRLVKNFRIEASSNNLDWYVVYNDITVQNSNPQEFTFNVISAAYRYWRLYMIDNWGDGSWLAITRFELFRFGHDGVAIQEWGMYENISGLGKKTISQLRLYPVAFEENEYYFTKQIEFQGSNDGFVWDTLLLTTNTPTPFTDYAYGRWSRYSFKNFDGYYQYKLKCYDNWRAGADIIKMAEWEMVESAEEFNNFRILAGLSNNINNIWADPTTTINSGTLYITNEAFNTIEYDKLIHHVDLDAPESGRPGHWIDLGYVVSDLTYDGTATASIDTYQGSSTYVPAKAFDNSLSTYWHSVVYSSYPIWLQYQFTDYCRIFEVRMYPRAGQTSRMPGNFIIKGSNTGEFAGEETDIVSITGATYSNATWTTFNFDNNNGYLYYRFHITAKAAGSGSGNYMNIYEVEMEGYVQEYIPEYVGEGGVDDFNVKL